MARTDNLISLTEAAEQLGVHYMTAYRYVRTGRLPGAKHGAEWRVDPVDLERFRAEGGTGPAKRGTGRARYPVRLGNRLIDGDEQGAWAIIEEALASGMSPEQIYAEVLSPTIVTIGEKWSRDELTVDQEHVASNIVLRLIGRLGPLFTRRGRKRGTVVLGAPPGDAHGIPLHLAADLLRSRGFDVTDLGANVPAPSFAHAVRGVDRLVAVGVCATTGGNAEGISDALTSVRTATGAPIVVGGRGLDDEVLAGIEQAGITLGPGEGPGDLGIWHTWSTEEALERFEAFATAAPS